MDTRERIGDFTDLLQQSVMKELNKMYIAAPCKILAFHPENGCADIQLQEMTRFTLPTTSETWKNTDSPDDFFRWEQPGPIMRCPVVMIQGAGYTIQAAPVPGSEALAVFAHRSYDNWWLDGEARKRTDLRRFSINDAFVIPGLFSKPNVGKWPPIDPQALVVTNSDTNIQLRMDAAGVTIKAPIVNINAQQTTVNGPLTVNGEVEVNNGSVRAPVGDVIASGVSLFYHQHGEVQSGGSLTGLPTGGHT